MIDNFELIIPLLKFDSEEEFFFLQIIQRKKDSLPGDVLGSNNNHRLIKAYYIYSIEQLLRYKEEIISLCTLFNARAGISLNKRNSKTLSLEMIQLLASNIKNSHYNQLSGLYNTVCGQYHQDKDKTWLLDIDDINFNSLELKQFLYNQQPYGDKYRATIPSKSGYHLIVSPFNPTDFNRQYPNIEIHKNNPTNLYIP